MDWLKMMSIVHCTKLTADGDGNDGNGTGTGTGTGLVVLVLLCSRYDAFDHAPKNHSDSFYERMLISPILLLFLHSQSHLLNDCVHYMPSILSTIILCCTINALTKNARDPTNKVSRL